MEYCLVEYVYLMAIVISADEIKKQLPDYTPEKSEDFHSESAKLADKQFGRVLKESLLQEVILLNGGTASGKSEFLSTQLIDLECIILDATLSTEKGARNKLRQIFKSGKTPHIYAVVPDDLRRAFIAFLNRERKFGDKYFYKTHSGSRKTLLWIALEYPDIEIKVVESSYTRDHQLQFAQIKFANKAQLIDYLAGLQKTEDDIITYVNFLSE